MEDRKLYRTFDWISRHIRLVMAAVLIAVLALGFVGPMVADTNDPNFDPEGGVFAIQEETEEVLASDSSIASATFLVESGGGDDVLTADALREWKAASDRIRTSTNHAPHLVTVHNVELGSDVPGVLSIADLVDQELPGGLAGATDADVKAALANLLDQDSPTAAMQFTLSELATTERNAAGEMVWSAPAFTTQIVYDEATFGSYIDSELWLREVQRDVKEGAVHTDPIGVAIDIDSTFDEAIQASAPFIFLAVALIVLLIAFVHRSYWSAILVAAGLGATMLAYNGIAALIGLKMGSLLLVFIVPIAMISFGVDFYIHGVGRVREMQVEEGMAPRKAYPAGMVAVFTAMLLAVLSSVAAFLANSASGIEAIVEFGIGAAIALGMAYLLLGQLAPRLLVGLESFVGSNPVKGKARFVYHLAVFPVAIIGGLVVTLGAVMPQVGAVGLMVVIVGLIVLPALLTRRRNRRARSRGRQLETGVRGAAHGLRPAGTLVHFLAKWRVVTVPVVLLIGAVGLVGALNVSSGFELEDFLSSRTDFVQSVERVEHHFPSSGEGSSYIFVTGDLTDPETLAALDGAVADLDGSGADFGRNGGGELLTETHAGDLVRMTMASPTAITEITADGIALADADGNGIPDTAAGVSAVFDYVLANGVATAAGETIYTPEEVSGLLASDGAAHQATAIVVQIGSFTDAAVIQPAWDALDAAAANLAADQPQLETAVSGEVITQFESLESFRNAMLLSLPLAVILTLLLATAILRSVRYAIAAVVPIGFVVTGVYAFMFLAGYTVNVVTATIAAIAVGVGIDFSTHFTARFREELAGDDSRLGALRRAGEGTGGALVLSALTSVLGFTVMAFAPTPIFATFGVLTAVMIALALFVALVILPSTLMILTPRRVPVRSDEPTTKGLARARA